MPFWALIISSFISLVDFKILSCNGARLVKSHPQAHLQLHLQIHLPELLPYPVETIFTHGLYTLNEDRNLHSIFTSTN